MKTKQVVEVILLAVIVFICSTSLYKILGIDKKVDSIESSLSSIQKDIEDGFIIVVD